jgi:hypothetical protein
MSRGLPSLTVLLVCLSACADRRLSTPAAAQGQPAVAPASPAASPVAPAAAPDRSSQGLDILEAVFRYQFEHNSSGVSQQSLDYFFLSLGTCGRDDRDPSNEFLARFAGHVPPVEPWSAAYPDKWMGAFHRKDRGRGILLRLSGIRWVDEHTIELEGGHQHSNRNGSGNTYRVKHRNGEWSVVSAEHKWQS